jgi:hypothetical protein
MEDSFMQTANQGKWKRLGERLFRIFLSVMLLLQVLVVLILLLHWAFLHFVVTTAKM